MKMDMNFLTLEDESTKQLWIIRHQSPNDVVLYPRRTETWLMKFNKLTGACCYQVGTIVPVIHRANFHSLVL